MHGWQNKDKRDSNGTHINSRKNKICSEPQLSNFKSFHPGKRKWLLSLYIYRTKYNKKRLKLTESTVKLKEYLENTRKKT